MSRIRPLPLALGALLGALSCGSPEPPPPPVDLDVLPLLRDSRSRVVLEQDRPVAVRSFEHGLGPGSSFRLVTRSPGPAELVVQVSELPSEIVRSTSRLPFDAAGVRDETLDWSDFEPGRYVVDIAVESAGAPLRLTEAILRAPEPPPDLVVVVIDTLRADGVFGPDGTVLPPSLARLAADGAAFTEAFAHAPATLASHTSLFSSRIPSESGVLHNRQTVGDVLPLLTDWLVEAGYSTRAAYSLGSLTPSDPGVGLDRGFAVYEAVAETHARADEVLRSTVPLVQDVARRAPFFLFAHFSDPHEPLHAHGAVERTAEIRLDGELVREVLVSEVERVDMELELGEGRHTLTMSSDVDLKVRTLLIRGPDGRVKWEFEQGGWRDPDAEIRVGFDVEAGLGGRHELRLWAGDEPDAEEIRQRYDLEIAYVDDYVGRLISQLERLGKYDSSLIVFTSDHGEAFGEHGFRGHGKQLYDESIHVPLVVKPPKGHPSLPALRAAAENVVGLVDVTPTILEILDLPELPGQAGRSLLEGGDRVVVSEAYESAVEFSNACIRDREFKLLYFPYEERYELYDLIADPEELHDVFETRRGEREEWIDRLRSVVTRAEGHRGRTGEISEEREAELRALGY